MVLPTIVGLVQVVGTLAAAGHEPARRPLDVLAFVLLVAGPAALVARGRYPVAVLLFTFVVTSAYELTGYPDGPVFFAVAVAVVAATMQGHRRAAVGVAALGYLAFVWGEFALGLEGAPEVPEAIAVGAWLVALLTIAEVVRVRRERFQEAMRTRAEARKRRASEERLRIAQELHDVLAHNISLINVQAGVALHLLDERPEQARPALAAIKEASNDALGELRSVLDVLREGSEGGSAIADRQSRSARPLARADREGGAYRDDANRRRRAPSSGRGGPGRLPHRAGIADERHPTCRRRDRADRFHIRAD
ncbi:hypothetical protein BH24ACT26_BH24ACT26_14270 [soil metagenome]